MAAGLAILSEIEDIAINFFKSLYTKDEEVAPDDLVDLLHSPISNEINSCLCRDISEEEIADTLLQIGPIKAPGPDGMPSSFFQRNWAMMKIEVTAAVLSFFQNGVMPTGINDTVILIPKGTDPKGTNPESLADYRPISLCNVIYKITSGMPVRCNGTII
jgi:hypothetical protein